jgi:glycosyltransferase involved in cell wall biosynthesis
MTASVLISVIIPSALNKLVSPRATTLLEGDSLRMRIVYLSPSAHLGGAEACLLDMLAVMRSTDPGCRLHLLLGEDGPLREKATGAGAVTQVLPFPPAIARFGDSGQTNRARLTLNALANSPELTSYHRALRRYFRQVQPDLVHSNGLKMHVLSALAKPRSAKLVWHMHDYVGSRALISSLLRPLSSRADALIAVSHSVAEDAQRTLRHANVATILNVVDLDRFSPDGPRADLDTLSGLPSCRPGTVRIGLLATMAWWKGHRLFLDAVAKLDPSLPFRAYIVGGSLYQTRSPQESIDALAQYAKHLGIGGRVGFPGFVAEPGHAIRALDVVVHASTEPEPFGRVIVEAMACAKPVISSGVGGAAEILSLGDLAERFENGDPGSLAEAMLKLLRSPSRQAELSAHGLQLVRERFGRDRLARELPSVYRDILGKASGALRILHLHSGNMIGGIESALETFAAFAPTCPEMQQEFALAFDGPLAGRLRSSTSAVHLLPPVQLRNPLSVIRSRRALLRLLRRRHFDAVISHSPWCQAVYAPAVRAGSTPLLFWMHGTFDGHWLQKLASRHAPDLAICNSHYTASTLARIYPGLHSEVVRNPVPNGAAVAGARNRLRRQFGSPENEIVVLMASRMEAWKGHFNLLHAAAQLSPDRNWTIWIAGAAQTTAEKEYSETIAAEVERLNLASRVKFLGQRSDVPDLMRAADIFCQPNAGPEPFGIVFVEALQAGVPVVTFSMGGPREILDESCGILVAPGDVSALARALTRLIDDSQLRARMGAAGPDRARFLCDPATQVRRVHDLVAGVVRSSASLQKGTSA